jgi:hypothetical protein
MHCENIFSFLIPLSFFVKKKSGLRVSLQLPVEILVYRIRVGSPEKLAAAHLNDDRRPHTHKTAEFRPFAD